MSDPVGASTQRVTPVETDAGAGVATASDVGPTSHRTVEVTAAKRVLGSNEVAHAPKHIRGGSDEIDGDLIDIDYAPSNYTPTVSAPATHAQHLTAHLAGIGESIGEAEDRLDALEASAGSSQVIAWRTFDLTTSNGVYYLVPWVLGSGSGFTTEAQSQLIWPAAGTFSKLYVRYGLGSGNPNQAVFTLRINGSGTPLTVTKPNTASTTSDTTHTASVAAGDLVSMKIDQSAGSPSSTQNVLVSWLFTPD